LQRSRDQAALARRIGADSLASYYARYHHNLLGSAVELINTLYSFTSLYPKGSSSTCALFIEDALSFSDSRYGFWIVRFDFVEIPFDSLIAATGHDPQHTHGLTPSSVQASASSSIEHIPNFS
jgi:hypothetical protein